MSYYFMYVEATSVQREWTIEEESNNFDESN